MFRCFTCDSSDVHVMQQSHELSIFFTAFLASQLFSLHLLLPRTVFVALWLLNHYCVWLFLDFSLSLSLFAWAIVGVVYIAYFLFFLVAVFVVVEMCLYCEIFNWTIVYLAILIDVCFVHTEEKRFTKRKAGIHLMLLIHSIFISLDHLNTLKVLFFSMHQTQLRSTHDLVKYSDCSMLLLLMKIYLFVSIKNVFFCFLFFRLEVRLYRSKCCNLGEQ